MAPSSQPAVGIVRTSPWILVLLGVGILVYAIALVMAAASADAARPAGAPSWGFLVVPVCWLTAGSMLVSFAGALYQRYLTLRPPLPLSPSANGTPRTVMFGVALCLIVLGVGLGVVALIVTSAFFYGCAPGECSTDTPIPAGNIAVAGNVGFIGVPLLVVGAVWFAVLVLLPSVGISSPTTNRGAAPKG